MKLLLKKIICRIIRILHILPEELFLDLSSSKGLSHHEITHRLLQTRIQNLHAFYPVDTLSSSFPIPCIARDYPFHNETEIVMKSLLKAEKKIASLLIQQLEREKIPGAIVEFGVFKGHWLKFLLQETEQHGIKREFYGFDSFQGLPAPDPQVDGEWHAGQFSCSYQIVARNLKLDQRKNLHLISGFFKDSLKSEEAKKIQKIAYARIDCDLYQSCVECLDYLTPRLSHGAILVFDDWTHNITCGETKAFYEWANAHPNFGFEFLFSVPYMHYYLKFIRN